MKKLILIIYCPIVLIFFSYGQVFSNNKCAYVHKDSLKINDFRIDKTYYSNGNIESIKIYRNDLLDGLCVFYNKNGTVNSLIEFQCGKKNGDYIIFDEKNGNPFKHIRLNNETIIYECHYNSVKNQKIDEWIYDETGRTLLKHNYLGKDGKLHDVNEK